MAKIRGFMEKSIPTKLKNLSADSLAITMFYVWQHYYGYYFDLSSGGYIKPPPVATCELNDHELYNFYTLLALYKLMQDLDIDNELVVITPIGSPNSSDIIDYGDYDLLLRTKSDKPIYFSMDNRFCSPYEIAARYQGQTATVLDVDLNKGFFGKSNSYRRNSVKIPVSTLNDNITKEELNVSFNTSSMNITEVDRTVSVAGYYRTPTQKQLCLPEETEKRNAKTLGVNDVITRLNESRSTRKTADEFQKLFTDAKANWRDDFKEEIKDQFGIEPKEVTSYDIKNYALRYWDKYFVFNTKFTMEGWVKKAGNNYLFEAGKLVGTYSRIDNKERDRKVDIYMPCARTFEFAINVNVPERYTAKGLEAFNKNITNESAYFVSTASQKGSLIIITVKRVFNNAFEPVANWKKLLEVMDACTDFTTQKLLFEKNK